MKMDIYCKGNIVDGDHFKRIYCNDINTSLSEFSKDFESIDKLPDEPDDGVSDMEADKYNAGFNDGKIEGIRSEKQKFFSKLNLIDKIIDNLNIYKKTIYKNAEKSALALALAIAKKIVYREVSVNKDVVLAVVNEALNNVMDHDKITLKINPEDMLFINENKKLLNDISFKTNTVKFVEDSGVESGGCLIETDSGIIDAQIESQFKAIEEVIIESFKV